MKTGSQQEQQTFLEVVKNGMLLRRSHTCFVRTETRVL